MRIKGKILVLEVRMPTSIVNWLLLLKAEKKERETKLNNKINKKTPHALLLAGFYLKYSYRFCFLFWG